MIASQSGTSQTWPPETSELGVLSSTGVSVDDGQQPKQLRDLTLLPWLIEKLELLAR